MKNVKRIAVGLALAAVSIMAGYVTMPDDVQKPVLLENGEVMLQPCYVTVNGECVALVDSEETAEKVVDEVKSEYKTEKTVDAKIQEETSVEEMELKNGDEKPEVLTEEEAKEHLVEDNILTVETKDMVVEGTTVQHEVITTESEDLHLGEVEVVQEGKDGFVLETKEIKRENGEVVSEKVMSEKVMDEPVAEIIIKGTSGLANPLDYLRITSEFGFRWGRQHTGVDFGLPEGENIYAAKSGKVVYAGVYGGYGNMLKIDHGDGLVTYYAHCSSLIACEGQSVETGEVIAKVGSTGNSTGPHLHFEVRVNDEPQNPLKWLL